MSSPASVAMSPRDLLDAAQELLTRPIEGTAGLWPKAAAVLIRQALEDQMTIILTKSIPGVHESSARTKLICLQSMLDDQELAEAVSHAWWALTTACHHRAYDLAPSAEELQRWLNTSRRLVSTSLAG